MDTPQPIPSFDESVAQVMQTLPPPIRNYLTQGKYTAVAQSLMAKYGLRIDQGGVLEREIMLLLMGIDNPDEFTKSLTEEAKLDQQTINSISKDVNEQIFVPLRAEMMKSGGENIPSAPPKPRPINASVPSYVSEFPKGSYAPPLQSPRYVNPALTELDERASLRDVLAAVTRPSPNDMERQGTLPAKTPIPSPAEKLLEDHEEPHIEFRKTASPPSNLPGVIQHPPLPTPEVRPSPVIPKVEPQIPVPPAKPYSSDPYREPIDEK